MRIREASLIALVVIAGIGLAISPVMAQGPTPTPTPIPAPLPAPNALLIYDQTTIALINTSQVSLSLADLTFWRSAGEASYNMANLAGSLGPGRCVQIWTDAVREVGKPSECAKRDRWITTANKAFQFWVASADGEFFRPKLNGNTLAICKASAGPAERCPIHIPQGDSARKPWAILDPASKQPMPRGLQVAYDANQIWIGNLDPGTLLPLSGLRLYYTVNNALVLWKAAAGPWDGGGLKAEGLAAGQCIVLYKDAAKVTPLLPCTPVARALREDQPWLLKFEVLGPREDRRAVCGEDQPPTGPVLCLVGG